MHQHVERPVVPLYVMVDMQPRWMSARSIVSQAEQVIHEAARTKSPVIVVEYTSEDGKEHSRTFKRLLDLMDKLGVIYIRTFKDTPSGHRQIAQVLSRTYWDRRKIKIFGVMTGKCIAQSSMMTAEIFPDSEVEVIARACNDIGGNKWSEFPGRPNLKIIFPSKGAAA